ncbi:hypothetical protein AZE42_04841 [Rhizopogon vesiculosus]|uniref:Uncharacterized protein n=1 Tax=Rhizopogon vesiculosus TaxID=180088 RepID=A0A1J8PI18_9AGAM|nr:hypothetical protein AZE42_04841 [Rhizopogon vesiculosus]
MHEPVPSVDAVLLSGDVSR